MRGPQVVLVSVVAKVLVVERVHKFEKTENEKARADLLHLLDDDRRDLTACNTPLTTGKTESTQCDFALFSLSYMLIKAARSGCFRLGTALCLTTRARKIDKASGNSSLAEKEQQESGRDGETERAKNERRGQVDIGLQPTGNGGPDAVTDTPGDRIETGQGGAITIGDAFHGKGGIDGIDQCAHERAGIFTTDG